MPLQDAYIPPTELTPRDAYIPPTELTPRDADKYMPPWEAYYMPREMFYLITNTKTTNQHLTLSHICYLL